MAILPKNFPEDSSSSHQRSWLTSVIMMGISLVVGTGLAAASMISTDATVIVTQAVIYSIAFFIAQEVWFSRNEQFMLHKNFDQMKSEFFRVQQDISDIESNIKLQGSVFGILSRTLDHEDSVIRDSFSLSISDFFDQCDLRHDRIDIKGDSISQLIYQRFWDILIEYQKRSIHNERNVVVYVSHSASLSVWDKEGILAQKQEGFVRSGGQIYRVLIKNKQSKDDVSSYNDVINEMGRHENLRIHFLDLSSRKVPEIHDYLMVEINGEYYVFEWLADWEVDSPFFGNIKASSLKIGKANYRNFAYKWSKLINVCSKQLSSNVASEDKIDLSSWKIPDIH